MNDRSSVSHDHSSKSAERLLLESQQNCPLNVREESWPPENHSMGRLGKRLIQTGCRSRMKDLPRSPVRFVCCAVTTASSVFTQPGSNSVIAVMSAARPLFHRKRKSICDLAMSQKCHLLP
jgi:hypothetical protein